jgi:hypothetical protein
MSPGYFQKLATQLKDMKIHSQIPEASESFKKWEKDHKMLAAIKPHWTVMPKDYQPKRNI